MQVLLIRFTCVSYFCTTLYFFSISDYALLDIKIKLSFSLWKLAKLTISFSRFLDIKYFLCKWFIQSGNSNSFHSLFPKWVPLCVFLSYLHSFKPPVKWETEVAKVDIFAFLLILFGKYQFLSSIVSLAVGPRKCL